MGSQISLILTFYVAMFLPAVLFFRANKVQGWLAVFAQASLILWPVLTIICLNRMKYSELRLYENEAYD